MRVRLDLYKYATSSFLLCQSFLVFAAVSHAILGKVLPGAESESSHNQYKAYGPLATVQYYPPAKVCDTHAQLYVFTVRHQVSPFL